MKCLSLMQEYLCVPERCQQDEEQRESHPIHRQLSELQVQISWDAAGYIPTGPDISVSQGCIHVLYDVIFFLLFALHRVIWQNLDTLHHWLHEWHGLCHWIYGFRYLRNQAVLGLLLDAQRVGLRSCAVVAVFEAEIASAYGLFQNRWRFNRKTLPKCP